MPAIPRALALTEILTKPLERQDMVLEDVSVTAAGRRSVVRVVVDLPAEAEGEIGLDQVATLSRAVSEVLDGPDGEAVLGQAPYVLEVTSPGVDRPLTQRRHWFRARGRIVEVTPVGGAPLDGRVTSVGDDGVVLGDALVPWAALDGARGHVQVEMRRPSSDDDAEDGTGDETDLEEDD